MSLVLIVKFSPAWATDSHKDLYQGLWDQETSFLFSPPELSWGRDPFFKKPGFSPNEWKEPTWTLSAIFLDGRESEAMINGIRVRVGDEIQGRIVDEIGANYVLLSRNESVIEVNIPSGEETASIRLEEIGLENEGAEK